MDRKGEFADFLGIRIKKENNMAWFDEARFYHIYPLGLTGAKHTNDYKVEEHLLRNIYAWIDHIKSLNCNAIYIGPLFESVGHGYETTDYKKLDSRLGDNEDLKEFVNKCHHKGIRVIFDAVFNHVGRDFFAFKDVRENRENSRYKDWFCNVNFWGNNYFNDGFSYDNWGGDDGLVKLNQRNPEVISYIQEIIRFWVNEFDCDGLRLDAADVLDFDYMKALRCVANCVKPDFYLMGEVIHGDYTRWVNEEHLHAVTNYSMNKALWSGHNEHNYFEIAHTERRNNDMAGQNPLGLRLYNFADNHDVERIASKVANKWHQILIYALCYTLPGVPSIYYGSEFGIEGKKERGSDWNLRPALSLADYKDEIKNNPITKSISILGRIREASASLSYGGYKELLLTNRQYAYRRRLDNENVIVMMNNDDNDAWINVDAEGIGEYYSCLLNEGIVSGDSAGKKDFVDEEASHGNSAHFDEMISFNKVISEGGRVNILLPANSCMILLPFDVMNKIGDQRDDVREESDVDDPAEKTTDFLDEVEKDDTDDSEAKDSKQDDTDDPEAKDSKQDDTDDSEVKDSEQDDTDDSEILDSQQKEVDIETLVCRDVSYEEMTIEELQHCIFVKMRNNGPVTPEMKKTITDNVYHNSLVNWVKSFR